MSKNICKTVLSKTKQNSKTEKLCKNTYIGKDVETEQTTP